MDNVTTISTLGKEAAAPRETFHPIHSTLSSSELANLAETRAGEIQNQYDLGVLTPREYLHQMQSVFMTAVLDMK